MKEGKQWALESGVGRSEHYENEILRECGCLSYFFILENHQKMTHDVCNYPQVSQESSGWGFISLLSVLEDCWHQQLVTHLVCRPWGNCRWEKKIPLKSPFTLRFLFKIIYISCSQSSIFFLFWDYTLPVF